MVSKLLAVACHKLADGARSALNKRDEKKREEESVKQETRERKEEEKAEIAAVAATSPYTSARSSTKSTSSTKKTSKPKPAIEQPQQKPKARPVPVVVPKKKQEKEETKKAVPTKKEETKKSVPTNGASNGHSGHPAPTPTKDMQKMSVFYATGFEEEAKTCLNTLKLAYCLDLPLNKRDGVMVMQGWNKVLAFKTAFEEALLCKWRILVAKDEAAKPVSEETKEDNMHWDMIDQVETCQDPIAKCFGSRLFDLEEILTGVIDAAIRDLCPHSQVVAREAYRPISDEQPAENAAMHLECRTLPDYFRLFARCGVGPKHWVLFCEAFVWTLKTHTPYADEHDTTDLEKPPRQGTFARFVAGRIATEAIKHALALREELKGQVFAKAVPRFWRRIVAGKDNKALIGETFYRALLTNYPELLDYFAKADMDSLAIHLVAALDLCVESIPRIGESRTSFRDILDHLGELHRKLGIPTYSYALVGAQLLDTLNPFFREEEELMKNNELPVTAKQLEQSFATLYGEVMSFTHQPMMREEKMNSMAESFFESVAEELKWSPNRLSKRLLEVKLEIASRGTYAHTQEELEIGARLAWRNSAKCVGRIAWNTLIIRDKRHVEKPEEIFKEVEEHLDIATGQANIQSVMTIFKPKQKHTWGTRFWSSQFVRYAGYTLDDGKVLGDPANVDLTEYLLRQKLWTPPKKKSGFDVLPVVLKVPGVDRPYVHQLPEKYLHEVKIQHPKFPKIAKQGARWCSVPAICNFNMNLGGVDYQCCPFNGWFLSTEVVRNLLERYHVGEPWAKIMNIDTKEDMWETKVATEIDIAVLHSFRKAQYTVVDPVGVGKSFCTHVVRERETFGRECPAQWSWIGGFLGYTNVTWHLEMRDFLVFPQYEYCAESMLLMDDKMEGGPSALIQQRPSASTRNLMVNAGDESVRVLIAYGSETGNSEAVALRLARAFSILDPIVKCLNDVKGLDVIEDEEITHMLILCSTFGKGELPRNASLFLDTEIPAGRLSNTNVAILALGSTLYPDYCRAGVLLDQKLQKAGSIKLVPLQKADSAIGAEGTIDDWCSLVRRLILPPHLETRLKAELGSGDDPATEFVMKWMPARDKVSMKKEKYQWPEDGSCMCISNDELLEAGDVRSRSTRRITFQLSSGDSYHTGDHLCASPLNSLGMVERFSRCFASELKATALASGRCKEKSDEKVILWQMKQPFKVGCKEYGRESLASLSFKTPVTLFEALQSQIDFALQSSMVHDLVTMLNRRLKMVTEATVDAAEILATDPLFVKYCELVDPILKGNSDEKSAATCSLTDQYPTILELFEEFSELFCSNFTPAGKDQKSIPVVPVAEVLAVLPRLTPRYYSISSSPTAKPSEVSITVGVLHKETPAKIIVDGVCSNYLARLRPGVDRVAISIQESSFRGPQDVEAPVIMIGPGTGLAPMMGFIEDRSTELKKKSLEDEKTNDLQCHLFFGCRTDADRIYKDEIEHYEDDAVLNFHLALSRAPDVPKTYVQNVLKDMGKEMCDLLLNSNTHYYICGDSKMADDCYEVCVDILRKHNSMSRVAAVQHLKRMRAEDRWQMDLWGIFHAFQESRDAVSKMKKKAAKVWLSRFVDSD